MSNLDRAFEELLQSDIEEKVHTPSFSAFMEFLAVAFDFYTDNKKFRSKSLTNARSMHAKQFVYADLKSYLLDLLRIEGNYRNIFVNYLLNVETVLSGFRAEGIFTTTSREQGDHAFFKFVIWPFFKRSILTINKKCRIGFFRSIDKIIGKPEIVDCADVVERVRACVGESIKSFAVSVFKMELSKLDRTSYFKVKKIEAMCEGLAVDLRAQVSSEKVRSDLLNEVRDILLAGRVLFLIMKYKADLVNFDGFADVESSASARCTVVDKFILSGYAGVVFEDGSMEKNNLDNAMSKVLNDFKVNIGCKFVDPYFSLSDEFKLKNKISYLPAWFLEKVEDAFLSSKLCEHVNVFERKFVELNKIYQFGDAGRTVAVLLIGTKVGAPGKIAPNALEPLAAICMEYSIPEVNVQQVCLSPFGPMAPERLEHTTSLNIELAIGEFNDLVRTETDGQALCNPLRGTDLMLGELFESYDSNGVYSSNSIGRLRAINFLDINLYDVLRKINIFLTRFRLGASPEMLGKCRDFRSSAAGDNINRYLMLSFEEKRRLLAAVDPQSFESDMKPLLEKGF